jgi:hypothetical protein
MTKKGTLKVTVVEARNLKDEDLIGKSTYISIKKEKNHQKSS